MTNELENIVKNIQTENIGEPANKRVAYRAGVRTGRLARNIVRYAKRYGVAELIATATSVGAAKAVYEATESESTAALASNLAGYVGFFGTVAAQEINSQRKQAQREQRYFGFRDAGTVAFNLVKEFGASTYIDMCLTRPAILTASIRTLEAATGGFVGKWLADVPFWIMSDYSRKYGTKIKDTIKRYVQKMKGGFE